MSQSDPDKVRTVWQASEQSVAVLNTGIQNLLVQRSERGGKRNVTLQKYRNALKGTQLNLGWSKVYAQIDGTVSSLQLSPGLYTTAAMSLLASVSYQTDIMTDFCEKSLRHTRVDTDVIVVSDALLSRVFSVRVTNSDIGILAGQEQVNSQSSQLEQSTRWVRDVQHIRIRVALNESLDTPLLTGACVTIQLYNSEGMFARVFIGAQIHLISWLHHVY